MFTQLECHQVVFCLGPLFISRLPAARSRDIWLPRLTFLDYEIAAAELKRKLMTKVTKGDFFFYELGWI